MCGLFGFYGDEEIDVEKLKQVAVETESRGPHAFGFAWIAKQTGRLRAFKSVGRISEQLDTLDQVAGTKMLVGHTRWATQGDPSDNSNNHPHRIGRTGWMVHNGRVPEYEAIIDQWGLSDVLRSECDSEVLAHLIDRQEGKLVDRFADAALATRFPLAMMAIWGGASPRMAFCRTGKPLHFSGNRSRGYYLASEGPALWGRGHKVWSIKPYEVNMVTIKAGRVRMQTAKL